MFKQPAPCTRSIFPLAIPALIFVATIALAMSPTQDPTPPATRPAHGLDILTVKNIGTEEKPVQLVIAISDTGDVDIEFVPQPMRVTVSQ